VKKRLARSKKETIMSTKKLSRRNFLKLSAMTAGGIALAGCQTATQASEANQSAAQPVAQSAPVVEQKDQTYVWLCAVTGVAFWIDGRKGLESAGQALGVKTEFLGPQE
jgi:ABC-type sugar transport system substrate-binding protein